MTGDSTSLNSDSLTERLDVNFALQAAGLGVWEYNPQTGLVNWDERCRALYGISVNNTISYQQAIQHIHPEDAGRVDTSMQRAMNPQSTGVYDEIYRTIGIDDGLLRWVRFQGRAYFTQAGEFHRFGGVAQEVTQSMHDRHKLEEREQTLRAVVDDVPPTLSLCLLVGPNWVIQAPNKTFIDTLDKGDDIEGKPLREVMPELVGQPFLELLNEVYTTGQPHQSFGTAALIVQQGTSVQKYFNTSYTPLRDAKGHVYAILNTSFNVTQQVLAQQALDHQQAQQRFLLQLSDSLRSLSDPLAVYYQTACLVGEYLGANRVGYAEDQGDGDTIVVLRNYVNGVADLQGTYQYADYGPLLTQFRAGRTVVRSDIANDSTLSSAEKEAHQVLQLGATLNKPLMKDNRLVAVLFIHYQQAHAWSDDELSLLELVAERLVVAVERAQSETALRQSEIRYRRLSEKLDEQVQQRTQELGAAIEELAASNAELEAANEEYAAINEELAESNELLFRSNENLQQFAYVASHDLQEPLRKVQSFGDLLTSQYGPQLGEGMVYLERMQAAASRMSTLIKDLLSYSRIATQRDTSGLVSLSLILKIVLTDLELVIDESKALVEVSDLPTIEGDRSQLEQLFQNLLSNALKFHRPHQPPHIQVRASQLASDELPMSVKPSRRSPAYHQIDVIDNGVGFDEKYLDRIFQVFQRLHGRNEFVGTGIGLAICEKVVTNHGGAITASSQPGQGATFSVYLPVQ